MKKLFTLFFSLLFAALFTTASAQQNIFVWKNGGNISVVSSASVDSVTFSVGAWLFNITTSTAVSVATNSFKAMASVSRNSNVKSISETPEVGVCYSDWYAEPTYADGHKYLGSSMTDYTFTIEYLDPGTTYYYRTYVKLLGEVYYDKNVYSITTLGTKVDGDKFVDLGLPSGLLWATCNVGAITPFEDGDYFAWGETETKPNYSSSTYKWYTGSSYTKYTTNGKTTLDAEDDVATVKWGKNCRMPSSSEFSELYRRCEWTWKSNYNGTSGYLVEGPNGNSIFLPASGYRYGGTIDSPGSRGFYWSSSLNPSDSSLACSLGFDSGDVTPSTYASRYFGFSVRPVAEK